MEKYKYNLITGGGGGPQIQPLIWVQSKRISPTHTVSPIECSCAEFKDYLSEDTNSKIVTEGLGKKTKTQSATKL